MEINLIEALQEVFGSENVVILDDGRVKVTVSPDPEKQKEDENGVQEDI